MAEPDEIPASLRGLAHRVPEDVRANCSATELRLRCEEVLDLQARADAAGDEGRARNLRRRAEKMLQAMSPAAYSAAHALLDEELAEAQRRQDQPGAMAVLEEMHRLERAHPQVPAERYMNAVQGLLSRQMDKLTIPPPPSGHFWQRRRQGRTR